MEVRQPGPAAAGVGTFSGEDPGLTPAALNGAPADGRGRAGFPLIAAKGLFATAAVAFGALCTLKLDSTRCGVNLG